MVRGDGCQCEHGRGRMDRMQPSGTNGQAGPSQGLQEPCDVSARERETRDTLVDEHGDGSLQVAPVRQVVTGPHSTEALGSGEERSGQHKRTSVLALLAALQSFKGRVMIRHSVQVVDISVLPVVPVEIVLGHGSLWPFKDGRFVHVVPDKGVLHCSLELIVFVQTLPPLTGLGVEAVDPVGIAWPARAFVCLAVLVMNGEVKSQELLIDRIVINPLDVRINDCHQFSAVAVQLFTHGDGVGE